MSRMTRGPGLVVSWLIATTCFAQENPLSQPKTKLEQFQAKVGVVLITNSTNIGTLNGKLRPSIAVEARELIDSSDNSRITGLAITVFDHRKGGRQSTSYIDVDEIDSLLKAIDSIDQFDKSATKQVDYRTKGDFAITRSMRKQLGRPQIAVQSGVNPPIKASVDHDNLAELKGLIARAQSALQSKIQNH